MVRDNLETPYGAVDDGAATIALPAFVHKESQRRQMAPGRWSNAAAPSLGFRQCFGRTPCARPARTCPELWQARRLQELMGHADVRVGLGLGVVKQLTELHGGSVSVASEGAGRGAKFAVRIPVLSAGSVVSAASTASIPVLRTENLQRVLLVDDNKDGLDLLAILLERAGHEVVTAHDGPEALTMLDRFHPSVAVIDISMPVMNGYDLAASIRAQQQDEQPVLVALTGFGQANDRERGRAAGFNEHLVKPVDLPRLLRIIARAHLATADDAAE